MVVANSADCLPRWFAWALPRFAEIIVVRSASEDGTDAFLEAVAHTRPAQVRLLTKDIVDIASQKQFCVDRATRAWRLVVDADEICEDVLWDGIVEQMEAAGADLLQLPRYNLQRDDAHHLSRGYPDLQERLFKRHVRFSTAPRHRTHHRMLGASKPIASRSPHILHWGHIRSVDQLAWKSRMRRQHADTDYIEGPGLRSHANWFHHRNQALDAEAVPLPAGPAAYIRQIEAQARRLTFDRDLP